LATKYYFQSIGLDGNILVSDAKDNLLGMLADLDNLRNQASGSETFLGKDVNYESVWSPRISDASNELRQVYTSLVSLADDTRLTDEQRNFYDDAEIKFEALKEVATQVGFHTWGQSFSDAVKSLPSDVLGAAQEVASRVAQTAGKAVKDILGISPGLILLIVLPIVGLIIFASYRKK
jgi:hypothetical protein